MQQKGKLWMADWRDATGKRRRKGFRSKKRAQSLVAKMRREATSKKPHASAPSPKSAKHGRRRTGTRRTAANKKRRSISQPSRATSNPAS
jgi:hypothetical protein